MPFSRHWILISAALLAVPLLAKADTLSLTNLVEGELLTTATHSTLYRGYRQGDPGVTNNWYRWVVKAETTGPDYGNLDFKWHVPDDFASAWNLTDGLGGLLIASQNGGEITGDWNGGGTSNNDAEGDYTRLIRVFDGGPFAPNSQLRHDNYLTIEYLARVGAESTTIQTNGFKVAAGGNVGGPWGGYITNSIPTPTKYVPPPPSQHASNLVVTATASTAWGSWQPGDGSGRLVVIRERYPVNWSPEGGIVYPATNDFSKTTDLGDWNRIVHSGSGTNLAVTGLSATTRYWFKVYEFNGSGSASTYLTSGVPAEASVVTAWGGLPQTNRVVNITENDGMPGVVDGTNLTWNYSVFNNSNIHPSSHPYNESVTQAILRDVYSSSPPTRGSLPAFWTLSLSPGSTTDLWNVSLLCSKAAANINPGDYKTFGITTYIPSTNHTLVSETCYGQGRLQTEGLLPPSPGDGFIGPTGVLAPPVPIVDIQENDGVPVVVGKERRWEFNITNNSDIEPQGNPCNKHVTEVILRDLYSSEEPTGNNLPLSWSISVLPGSTTDLWRVSLVASIPPAYISPGNTKTFGITTYIPSEDHTLVSGTCYGQGGLDAIGYQPPDPGDGFIGPTGVLAPPVPIVDIQENDGVPVVVGNERRWEFNVTNNSDVEPQGTPYNKDITEIALRDMYSSASPTANNLPGGWSLSVLAGSTTDLWNVRIVCSQPLLYIKPGNTKTFGIATHIPSTNHTLVSGTCYGQGGLDTIGYQPPDPGDGFIGPTGVLPPPLPIVDIMENDGFPSVRGTTQTWDYSVFNNSNVEPQGMPYNEDITEVILRDVYSSSPPTPGTLPAFWTLSLSPGSTTDLWNVTFLPQYSFANITPGQDETFPIKTYIPSTNHTLVSGTCYGQGRLTGEGFLPPLPGDGFIGPTGVLAPITPARISSMTLTGGVAAIVITNLTDRATHAVERSHDLLNGSWTTTGVFTVENGRTNWSEQLSNDWQRVFYRVKSR
jgi:hypothetical protein